MDVEKITKINALAKELKKHGIVDSFDNGAKLAKDIIEKSDQDNSYEQFQDQVQRTVEKTPSLKEENKDPYEREINRLKQHITTLTNKMNELVDEINRLNVKVDKIITQPLTQSRVIDKPSQDLEEKEREEKTRAEKKLIINPIQEVETIIQKMFQ